MTVISLFGMISVRAQTDAAREELLAKNLSVLKETISDTDADPSIRYNAILAVGQLVSVEPSPGNPPVAYPAALLSLVEVYQKPDAPYYLKYGALLGINRHAVIGIAPDQQDRVIDLLLETIMTEFEAGEPLLNAIPLEPAAWHWFRLTALDGLAALKTVGKNGKIVSELLAVIDRQSQELEELAEIQNVLNRKYWEESRRLSELASKAAKTLGDLDYTSATDIDAKQMTDTFIGLTKAVCGIEHKMAATFLELGGTYTKPAILLERIVINVKMCVQSVVWGIRGGFLTAKPTGNSFYTSLEADDPAIERLNTLLAEIMKLSTFLDEGNPPRRSVLSANVAKEFQFDLTELRDALEKIAENMSEMQRED